MGNGEPRETLGLTEDEMLQLMEELLRENAEEAATANGTTPAHELATPGFAAARSAMSYAVHLIAANNAYFTRHLLDLGIIPPGAGLGAVGPGSDEPAEPA